MTAPARNRVYRGDHFGKTSPAVLPQWPEEFVDAVVCDPPYELGFMGKTWDASGIAYSVEFWKQVYRVMKPGAHLLAFGGTRTYHRMACAIEDAGFEVRDQLQWIYGSGFPKSLNVGMAIDKLDASVARRARDLRFTEWMRSTGISIAQINAATSSVMGSHYLTDKEQPAVATADMFDKLRPILPAVPEWVEAMVRERTIESENFKKRAVVGKKMAPDPAKVRLGVPGRDAEGKPLRGSKEIALTKAHTEAAQAWEGWGTALKPANEPIVLARKPLGGTVAENVLEHGTGAINVDATRLPIVGTKGFWPGEKYGEHDGVATDFNRGMGDENEKGRWPANVMFDQYAAGVLDGRAGDASRFFYVAKPDTGERNAGLEDVEPRFAPTMGNGIGGKEHDPETATKKHNHHPTVKPVDLMAYLIQLVTPRGGGSPRPFPRERNDGGRRDAPRRRLARRRDERGLRRVGGEARGR